MASAARSEPGDEALILPPPRRAPRRDLAGASAKAGAIVSGILLALSFPRYGHPMFAWIALTPLIVPLFAPRQARGALSLSRGEIHRSWPEFCRGRAFLLGWIAGLGYFAGTVYWTGTVVSQFGGLAWPVGIVVAALLVAYLALFPGLFTLCLGWLGARFGSRAILLAPAVWVTTELGRTYFWSGFPWLLLGYSQTTVLPVAQFASVVGVFGMSALVALVAAVLAYFAVMRSIESVVALVTVAVMLIGITVWGNRRLESNALTGEGRPVRVALIQGNIPQDEKWDTAHADRILDTYLTMTRQAAGQGARLVIWPESATPFPFMDDARGDKIRALVRETGIELLLGSDQVDAKTKEYYNAAYLVRKDASVAAVYQKMHLVPFGEFVPLQQLLFFVGPLVEQVGGFTAGRDMVLLPTSEGPISTAICYEIVFPRLVRESVLRGSQMLTTITNDAWYGRSSAPFQHFLQAQMRAIEQGRYLARAANTGISGFVDPYGRVLDRSEIFEREILIGDVRMLESRTIYGTIGDLFAYICAALTAAALIFAPRRRLGAP
jgi:apolipoprotein N-acyltransferase